MPRALSQRRKGRGSGQAEEKKGRIASIKNRIRSVQRLLRKELPAQVKLVQEKKLEELQKLADEHAKSELERTMALRYRKVKFFERRKVERRIRRVERQQRVLAENPGEDRGGRQALELGRQLAALKEDLEYIRFFPKTERYVSLFLGNEDEAVVQKRQELREKIKNNLAEAAAAGHDLEETGSEDDGALDMSEDDFFMDGSSSEDADADDELGDDTSREQVLPSPREAAISSRPSKQRQAAAVSGIQRPRTVGNGRNGPAAKGPLRPANLQKVQKVQKVQAARVLMPPPPARPQGSSGSDAPKPPGAPSASGSLDRPRRKRARPKKKKGNG